MPFIPHTDLDIAEMLATIGINDIDTLFDEIPASLRQADINNIPVGVSEMDLAREMREQAQKDAGLVCFIGAGAYEHHIPAAVWEVASRGEFMTAYTPYQAEASQGTLQLIYEYQTMMASLMGMGVSNASLYDGASALAEAVLMAIRLAAKKGHSTILLPQTVHPYYRQVVKTIVSQHDVDIQVVPYEKTSGRIDRDALAAVDLPNVAALVIPQPNFFGVLEEVDSLTDWAQMHGILTIGLVNPMAMALLKPPGQWGENGVDIACGDGQPFGIPLASGGPYYGFLCTKKSHVRQMPGRIVGRTVDLTGKRGYVLTLQAREQHIRRAKATSNICTNQGLMVTASTIYMSLMGPQGLCRVALLCHQRTKELQQALAAIPGVEIVFSTPFFHEMVLRVSKPVKLLLAELAKRHIQGGFSLTTDYPELGECLVVCATETKTSADIQQFAKSLREVLEGRKFACLV
jgi:glycine dehydrogenase subunit 1